MSARDDWADHCPTCGQEWAPADEDCAVIKPGTEHDVVPVRCRLSRLGHPVGYHWHPSLWTGTPDLLWEAEAR